MTPLQRLSEIEARLKAAGYTVLNDGRVWSHLHDWRGYGSREMKQDLNSHGYPRVRLTIDGRRKTFLVHKLVAEIYLGVKPSDIHEVCHIDGNKMHNHVRNLKWGTRADNAKDRQRHGNCYMTKNASALARKSHERKRTT